MRRRAGFTLVEMMVAMALVLFIMVILTEAFGKGLESFRQLKAIGDLESRLRAAATLLRRDLAADHFEGKRRLSDPGPRWTAMGAPREGFFRHALRPGLPWVDVLEGADSEGIGSRRRVRSVLHFAVKLRGNDRSQFFAAKVPAGSPLLSQRTTFFDQPRDARYQEDPLSGPYQSQWAEVAYWLANTGNTGRAGVYTLYRSQFVVAADNSLLNWPAPVVRTANPSEYDEISCKAIATTSPVQFYINNPTDLNTPGRRAFDPVNPTTRAAMPLLHDVLSFDVNLGAFDTGAGGGGGIATITITLRVWDAKSRQTRQVTLVQDL